MKRWGFWAGPKFLIVYARTRTGAANRLVLYTGLCVVLAELVDIGPSTFSPNAIGRDAA
jgi:hypothetical protein